MPAPFDFTSCANLPPALAAQLQAVANDRAARGLISADGVTHATPAKLAAYEAGHGVHSAAYRDA
jgi:alkaline phosphatase